MLGKTPWDSWYNLQESKVNIGSRNVVYVIKKSEKKWWNRLLKQEGKPPVFLKVDWDKWVDEDEENGKWLGLLISLLMCRSPVNMSHDIFYVFPLANRECWNGLWWHGFLSKYQTTSMSWKYYLVWKSYKKNCKFSWRYALGNSEWLIVRCSGDFHEIASSLFHFPNCCSYHTEHPTKISFCPKGRTPWSSEIFMS